MTCISDNTNSGTRVVERMVNRAPRLLVCLCQRDGYINDRLKRSSNRHEGLSPTMYPKCHDLHKMRREERERQVRTSR